MLSPNDQLCWFDWLLKNEIGLENEQSYLYAVINNWVFSGEEKFPYHDFNNDDE